MNVASHYRPPNESSKITINNSFAKKTRGEGTLSINDPDLKTRFQSYKSKDVEHRARVKLSQSPKSYGDWDKTPVFNEEIEGFHLCLKQSEILKSPNNECQGEESKIVPWLESNSSESEFSIKEVSSAIIKSWLFDF